MTNDRIKLLANDLYDHVWVQLDGEPDVNSEDAAKIAFAVQAAFEQAFHRWDSDEEEFGIEEANELGFTDGDEAEDAFAFDHEVEDSWLDGSYDRE